jgi:type II restriction/modification system DNA methylase subunit YeeA
MTPEQFISTWKNNPLTERAGAQPHFEDLCDLLGVEKPRDPENYCFERGAKKSGGGDGWADVWKRGYFGWENKKPGRDLKAALKQLTDYALQLENPPLLVVCDREKIEIHTAFTGYPDEPREIKIEQLIEPETRQLLKWVFTDSEKLRPEKSTAAITAEAAGQFAQIAASLRSRGEDGQKVAHFLVQCLFCMFAEDEALLPPGIFSDLLKNAGTDTEKAARRIDKLFHAMQKRGGEYGDHDIAWFNGGLFKHIEIPPLNTADIQALHRAAADMDWRAIDPTIFGTLFERGLDPAARAPLGAHYTDTGTIAKLIEPLVTEPLAAEWQAIRTQIAALAPKFGMVKGRKKNEYRPNDALQTGHTLLQGFFNRINAFRVLDPACGSGNFLYLALKALRDIEKRAHVDAQELGLQPELAMHSGPHNILGIEINEFAAELARVTVWIGDIQWCRRNGYPHAINPILKPLDGIEHRDALLNTDGSEADWPDADVIVGNPPFLGGSRKSRELGREYFAALDKVYSASVPGFADLVCYWFHKALKQIAAGKLQAAGLVSTNSIRGGANRAVLDAIVTDTNIFEAWSDEPWINEGAAVRVSLIGFGPFFGVDRSNRLNGTEVEKIHADLTAEAGIDLSRVTPLTENALAWAYGSQEKGNFAVSTEAVLAILPIPNPNGKPNSDVIRRSVNARQIAQRRESTWVVDFGLDMTENDASLYEKPFAIVQEQVAPARLAGNDKGQAKRWWLHARPSPKYRAALKSLPRLIVSPCVSKHRLFVFLAPNELADHGLAVIARADDLTFGILHSRFHELWSLRLCTYLGVGNDPRYTPSTTFETFPFPEGMTPRDTATKTGQASPPCMAGDILAENIAAAARRLNELREAWLNPVEWVDWVITPEEEKAGFPKRPVAKPGHEAELKKRTLTNLYNARPAWLDLAHKELDKAVAAAYGWTDYTPEMADDEILRRLLTLNLERSAL